MKKAPRLQLRTPGSVFPCLPQITTDAKTQIQVQDSFDFAVGGGFHMNNSGELSSGLNDLILRFVLGSITENQGERAKRALADPPTAASKRVRLVDSGVDQSAAEPTPSQPRPITAPSLPTHQANASASPVPIRSTQNQQASQPNPSSSSSRTPAWRMLPRAQNAPSPPPARHLSVSSTTSALLRTPVPAPVARRAAQVVLPAVRPVANREPQPLPRTMTRAAPDVVLSTARAGVLSRAATLARAHASGTLPRLQLPYTDLLEDEAEAIALLEENTTGKRAVRHCLSDI
jgi:hypothetical protein